MHYLSCFNRNCYWVQIPSMEGKKGTLELTVKGLETNRVDKAL